MTLKQTTATQKYEQSPDRLQCDNRLSKHFKSVCSDNDRTVLALTKINVSLNTRQMDRLLLAKNVHTNFFSLPCTVLKSQDAKRTEIIVRIIEMRQLENDLTINRQTKIFIFAQNNCAFEQTQFQLFHIAVYYGNLSPARLFTIKR